MENLLDPSKYKRIHSIALDKSPWLNTSETEYDENGVISFLALTKIISGDDNDIIGRIVDAYSTINDNYQDIREIVRINLSKYWFTSSTRWFAVIIGTKISTFCTEHIGITHMACVVIFLTIHGKNILYLLYRFHMMGKGKKLTTFLSVVALAYP